MTSVAIIGSGPAGLTACKEALACGLKPTVFEKANAVGGGWRPDGFAWDSMTTNISQHTQMYSDFPFVEGTPDFPSHKEYYEYQQDYAKTFKIHPHVRLNSEVQKVFPSKEKWVVQWKKDGKEDSEAFDHVIVCSGIFSQAFTPEIPGLETFKGTIFHSREYKKPDAFEGKTVTVIGNAFSGCEIAGEIATKADMVFHATRKPLWILPRYLKKADTEKTIPADLIFYSRTSLKRSQGVDAKVLNTRKNTWFKGICSEQEKICPDLAIKAPVEDPPFVTISDSYLKQVQKGKVQVHLGSIQKIEGDTVIYHDGTVQKTDALVFCTGYRTTLPFFDADILEKLGYQPDDPLQPLLLHKTVFPRNLEGLTFIGMYRGPFPGVEELQAQRACMSISGQVPFPSAEEIEKGIKFEEEIRNAKPRPQFPHGNYVEFCEDLAKEIGVLPDFAKIEKEDPVLFDQLVNGPFTTASYRLNGPGSNPGLARKIIQRINKAAE